jgi:hypothetical protein
MSNHPDDPVVVAAASGRFIPGSRGERRKRRTPKMSPPARAPAEDEAVAYSIKQFCARHGISQSLYFELQKDKLGPLIMEVRGRVLISKEAARRWRRAREAAAKT